MVSVLTMLRLGVLALAACALAAPVAAQGRGRAVEQSVMAGDIRLDALPSQPLDRGRCGLFVWAQNAQQPVLVMAAFSNPSEAVVKADGRERLLRRTQFGGEIFHGHFDRQTFANDSFSLTLDVTFDRERDLRDGAVVRQGVLRVVDREDWETIVPISGVLACPT
jgi:hypothetical protein